MKHSYSNDDTCFSIDVINEILEEDFDALLDEGSKLLYSIEGTLLEEEIFAKFDEFMAMTRYSMSNQGCLGCMLAIFHDTIEESVKVFMDDFSVFGNSFDKCLNNLDKILQRCKDAHLFLNWENCHFMVKEGIVLGHKVSSTGLEVDKEKINVISKLPPLLTSKVLGVFLEMPIFTKGKRGFQPERLARACSFMLCDLDFEPLSLSLSSLPSCDLLFLTNMLILLHYLESFKSELAELKQFLWPISSVVIQMFFLRAQWIKPTLYDGNVLCKTHDVIPVVDEEENMILTGLHDEITEVQTIFTQMEAAMEQCSVDKKFCEIQQKQFFIENDQLLDKIISQEIMNIVLNSSVVICDSKKKNNESVDICNKCLELEAEFVKKNDLQAKDTIISKLKETIHSLRENVNPARVKQDIDDIETINIELEHSVAKSLFENEKLHKEKVHLKKTYNELYDSIKPTRVHAKEQCDSLIANLNSKSMENADLKTQILEKVFANEALKNELRKLKGKNVIDTAVSKRNATTIAPGMCKLDLEPLAPKVLKNKDAHIDYIKNSKEHADTLQEIVENARALSPLDSNLDLSFAVTPKNKDKKVRFDDPVTSSRNTQKQVLLWDKANRDVTKNNRISRPSSSNKTNKVADQSRSVKSRTNKKNHVSKIEYNVDIIHSMLNANSKSVCAIYNECLFDANHVKCVLDYVHDVNVLVKYKPAKRKNKKKIWKPMGKVYTEIGYK
ncbi:hypothetical protein Tco_0015705 [Tanacetum coccineum]